jgi:hypothetical protein
LTVEDIAGILRFGSAMPLADKVEKTAEHRFAKLTRPGEKFSIAFRIDGLGSSPMLSSLFRQLAVRQLCSGGPGDFPALIWCARHRC